jgi:hypothetical protein
VRTCSSTAAICGRERFGNGINTALDDAEVLIERLCEIAQRAGRAVPARPDAVGNAAPPSPPPPELPLGAPPTPRVVLVKPPNGSWRVVVLPTPDDGRATSHMSASTCSRSYTPPTASHELARAARNPPISRQPQELGGNRTGTAPTPSRS